MVSTPFYDANTLEQQWDQISGNPGKPLLNRATQGLYTPGSVYKIITASAVVDLGLMDVDKPYVCRQDLVVDGFHISSHNHDAPRIDFEQGFAFSCNVTFARAGLGLGTNPLPEGDDLPTPLPWDTSIEESRKRFVDYSRRFGMDGSDPLRPAHLHEPDLGWRAFQGGAGQQRLRPGRAAGQSAADSPQRCHGGQRRDDDAALPGGGDPGRRWRAHQPHGARRRCGG